MFFGLVDHSPHTPQTNFHNFRWLGESEQRGTYLLQVTSFDFEFGCYNHPVFGGIENSGNTEANVSPRRQRNQRNVPNCLRLMPRRQRQRLFCHLSKVLVPALTNEFMTLLRVSFISHRLQSLPQTLREENGLAHANFTEALSKTSQSSLLPTNKV